jgi:hypothetical protein
MSAPRLIGLGGRLASGKDVVADHLVADHGFVKLGFGDIITEFALVLNPIVGFTAGMPSAPVTFKGLMESIGYVAAKEHNAEFREFLQRLGTDVGRKMIGVDFWVDMARIAISDHLANGQSVAFTGLRYPNEVGMIEALGGQTWWVERPSRPGTNHSETSAAAHASELGVNADDFARHLVNDGTIAELQTLASLNLNGLRHGIALTLSETLQVNAALAADFLVHPEELRHHYRPTERTAA